MMTLTRKKAMDLYRADGAHNNHALTPNITSTDIKDLVLEKCKRIMTGYTSAVMEQVPITFAVDPRVSTPSYNSSQRISYV